MATPGTVLPGHALGQLCEYIGERDRKDAINII